MFHFLSSYVLCLACHNMWFGQKLHPITRFAIHNPGRKYFEFLGGFLKAYHFPRSAYGVQCSGKCLDLVFVSSSQLVLAL